MTASPLQSSLHSPSPSAATGEGLVSLLGRQRDLYEQLRQLGRRQADLIRDGEAEGLLALLAQRQRLIDELLKSNSELAPLRSRWSQLFASLPPQRQRQVSELVREVEAQLASIIEQDEKDRAQLRQTQQQVGGELKRMSQASAARQAYGAPGIPGIPGIPGVPGASSASGGRFTSQQG